MRKLTIFLFLFSFYLCSCQSEYSEQMQKAKELKQMHTNIRNVMAESKNSNLKSTLAEIENEIKTHAILSGNEEHFLKQVWDN